MLFTCACGLYKVQIHPECFFKENLKESEHLIEEDIDRKIILKINMKFLGYDDGK